MSFKHGIHPRLMKPPKVPSLPHSKHERVSGVTVPKKLIPESDMKEYENASRKGKI